MRIRRLRRSLGVSTVIANLLMITITLSLAAILVAWAGSTYGTFSSGSALFFGQRDQALQERFVIENVFFNITGSNQNIMVVVRNIGTLDFTLVAIYVNGNSGLAFSSSDKTYLCQNKNPVLPVTMGVQAVCEFNLDWGQKLGSGTVFTVVAASSRGDQATFTARAPTCTSGTPGINC